MPLISFSHLIVLGYTSSTLLKSKDDTGQQCLSPKLRGKAFNNIQLAMISAIGFYSSSSFGSRKYLSLPNSLSFLCHNVFIFSCIGGGNSGISLSLFEYVVKYIDCFWMLNSPCILGRKFTWSWCILFFLYRSNFYVLVFYLLSLHSFVAFLSSNDSVSI